MKSIPKQFTNQCYKFIEGNKIFKKKHNNDISAIEEAKRLNNLKKSIHKFIAYKCAICNAYHVGKSLKEIIHKNNIYKH